jgi:hypothetical protein
VSSPEGEGQGGHPQVAASAHGFWRAGDDRPPTLLGLVLHAAEHGHGRQRNPGLRGQHQDDEFLGARPWGIEAKARGQHADGENQKDRHRRRCARAAGLSFVVRRCKHVRHTTGGTSVDERFMENAAALELLHRDAALRNVMDAKPETSPLFDGTALHRARLRRGDPGPAPGTAQDPLRRVPGPQGEAACSLSSSSPICTTRARPTSRRRWTSHLEAIKRMGDPDAARARHPLSRPQGQEPQDQGDPACRITTNALEAFTDLTLLAAICKPYLDMTYAVARRKHAMGTLPIKAFRLSGHPPWPAVRTQRRPGEPDPEASHACARKPSQVNAEASAAAKPRPDRGPCLASPPMPSPAA